MYLWDKTTGDILVVDAKASRIGRLRRRCYAWATALDAVLKRVGHGNRLVMLTLTYAGTDLQLGEPLPQFGWKPNHIRDFMKQMRRSLKKDLLAYAWVAELQQRGATHYHVLVLVRAGTDIPYPDQVGWWPHGSTRVETARTVFYIMKYAQKARFVNEEGEYMMFPRGLRIFSVWIGVEVIEALARWVFRSSAWPQWLRETLSSLFPLAIPRPYLGGGWFIEDDALGEMVFQSPWSFSMK